MMTIERSMHSRFPARAASLLFALLAGACASTGVSPRPFPLPGGSGTGSAAAGGARESPPAGARAGGAPAASPGADRVAAAYALTGTALELRGTPYRNGGANPATGFDCSGFTQYVFAEHGLSLPREVRDQFRAGKKVDVEDLEAGDLIFFTTTAPGPTHVAIAIGGDQFIHAPSSRGVVRIERLSSSYWAPRFLTARRVLDESRTAVNLPRP